MTLLIDYFFIDYKKFFKYNSLRSVCKDKRITKIFRNIFKNKKIKIIKQL